MGSASTVVSEEALPGGSEHLGDTDGDAANDVTSTNGNVALTDPVAGATFTTALVAPVGSYTSGGQAVVWTLSNNGQTLTGKAGATTVLVVTIDNSGHYTTTLSAPIDGPTSGSGENAGDRLITVGITAVDNHGNTASSGSLAISVEDDAPTAHADANSVTEGATLTVSNVSTAIIEGNTKMTSGNSILIDAFCALSSAFSRRRWRNASELERNAGPICAPSCSL